MHEQRMKKRNDQQKRKHDKCLLLLLAVLLCAVMIACGRKEEETAEGSMRIYYIGREETRLEYDTILPEAEDQSGILNELISRMEEVPSDTDYRSPLSFGTALLECRAEDGILTLSMDEHYRELKPTTEILLRAALVRTFAQVPGITGVVMQIGEEPLLDQGGAPVGIMTADTFVENEGTEINAYEKTTLHLYYADTVGTGLVGTQRTLVYNTNISMERLVMEQLIAGPAESGLSPVLPADTRILSVSLTDGTCYVNLSSEFLKSVESVTPEVTIYSIVDSLAELPNVYQVQLMVNGESGILYREIFDLSNPLPRNLDLVD